jgi:hypothetical protein
MVNVPDLIVRRDGHVARFHGSWYRGPHTNFIPSKAELRAADAVDRYILQGWLPEAPFITKQSRITAFGSCFAQHLTAYLLGAGYNVLGKYLGLGAHIIHFGEDVNTTSASSSNGRSKTRISENLWFGEHKEIAALGPHQSRNQTNHRRQRCSSSRSACRNLVRQEDRRGVLARDLTYVRAEPAWIPHLFL